MRTPSRLLRRVPLLLLALAAVHGSAASAFTPSGLLEIHHINVQQGSSTLVIGPTGTTLLMDAGRSGKGLSEIVPYLMSIGLLPSDGLDYTLAGHLDSDHIGGFDEVLAAYNVRRRNYFNGSNHTGTFVDAYVMATSLTSAGAPRAVLVGETIDLGGGAVLTFVAAKGVVAGHGLVAATDDENDLSVAVLIQLGGFDYVWAGDLGGGDDDNDCTGRTTDQRNLETPLARAMTPGGGFSLLSGEGVDVLHVSHHGSESSTNSDWMNLLRPEVAVISVGSGQAPSFQHPRKDVVEKVLLAEAPCITAPAAQLVLQTEEGAPIGANTSQAGFAVGDVKIVSDGASYEIEATGAVSQGPDERAEAGLPLVLDGDETSCQPDATTLCLLEGRFEVKVSWRRPDGGTGVGQALSLTNRAGLFWFFNADNLELLVKMVDACTLNERFWVFYAATTNVEFSLRVTDTREGRSKVYSNPLNTPAVPVQDTGAFATCT